MARRIRLATFNLEELDSDQVVAPVPAVAPGRAVAAGAGVGVADPAPRRVRRNKPTLEERIKVLRPQLERLQADILCLQEVFTQEETGQPPELRALEDLIRGTYLERYEKAVAKNEQAIDPRQRRLVILSRYRFIGEPEEINQTPPFRAPQYDFVTGPEDEGAKAITWERPILRVRINLGRDARGNPRVLHLLNVHMKSKIPVAIKGRYDRRFGFNVFRDASSWAEGLFVSSMKRVGQAMEARMVIDTIFDDVGEDALIAICGDFNAMNDETPLKAIRGPIEDIGNQALVGRIMIPCEQNVPEPGRYSLFHQGRGEMIDHVLVSRGMFGLFRHTEIHNEALPDESGAFRTDAQFPESDHAPVVAEFEIPDAE